MDIRELKQIYSSYEEALARAHGKASIFAGLFGQGSLNDPRNDPCNREFYESTGRWIEAFAASNPEEAEAASVCRWVLDAAYRNRNKPVYWYYLVSQGYVKKLVPPLSPLCRESLAADYD